MTWTTPKPFWHKDLETAREAAQQRNEHIYEVQHLVRVRPGKRADCFTPVGSVWYTDTKPPMRPRGVHWIVTEVKP